MRRRKICRVTTAFVEIENPGKRWQPAVSTSRCLNSGTIFRLRLRAIFAFIARTCVSMSRQNALIPI
jgi:hypothetical protein